MPALPALLILTALTTCAFILWMPAVTGNTSSPVTIPGLFCDAPTHDFGRLSAAQASSLQHEFKLRNTSLQPIRIRKKTATCGCTSSDLSSDIINPGEPLTVRVTVDWAGRSGPQSVRVLLQTDHSSQSTVTLSVVGLIEYPIVVSPRHLDFGELDPGLSDERTFHVSYRSADRPFSIHAIHPSDPIVQVRRIAPAHLQELAGPSGRFAVRVDSPRSPGSRELGILVYTSLDPTPVPIRMSLRSRGAIRPEPKSVLIDFNRNPEQQSVEVQVRVAPQSGFRVITAAITSASDGSYGPYLDRNIAEIPPSGSAAKFVLRCDNIASGVAVATLRITSGDDVAEVPIVIIGRELDRADDSGDRIEEGS